jgi:hypothetical protein
MRRCPASRPGRDAQIAEAGRYKCWGSVIADGFAMWLERLRADGTPAVQELGAAVAGNCD